MATKQNLAVVQAVYEAFGRGDIPALLEQLAPDVDWRWYGPEVIPHAGRYRGREAVLGFFGKVVENLEILEFEPQRFLGGEEHVLVMGREKVRSKATGKTFETPFAHIFLLSGGRITDVHEFVDSAAAAAASTP